MFTRPAVDTGRADRPMSHAEWELVLNNGSKLHLLLREARRYVRSRKPGTLKGAALDVARVLAEIDGQEAWAQWLVEAQPAAKPAVADSPELIKALSVLMGVKK